MTTVRVNGVVRECEWLLVTYGLALDLARVPVELRGRDHVVTYSAERDGWIKCGTLTPGQAVEVVDGMIFNVANTGSA